MPEISPFHSCAYCINQSVLWKISNIVKYHNTSWEDCVHEKIYGVHNRSLIFYINNTSIFLTVEIFILVIGHMSRSSLRTSQHPSQDECLAVVYSTCSRPTVFTESCLLGDPRDYRAASTQFPAKSSWAYH